MELTKGDCAVIPWTPRMTGEAETLLATVWGRLHKENLYTTVFHESDSMTFSQFIQFFSRNDVAPQVLGRVGPDGKLADVAGMTWLASIEDLPSHVRRAVGSFVFFRDYWRPQWTDTFGRMVLDYWFSRDGLAVDLLTAVTPEPNRAARLYVRRCFGVNYNARLKDYTSFNNQPADAMVLVISRDEYLTKNKNLQ